MKTKALLLALAVGASTCVLMAQDTNNTSDSQPPPRLEGGPGAGPRGRGGPGGFHLLPPRAQEQLKLTADQQKQVADLEAEVKAKMAKILTPEQLQQLKQMRPPRLRGGPGGPGGERGPGSQDGEHGQGGPPPADSQDGAQQGAH